MLRQARKSLQSVRGVECGQISSSLLHGIVVTTHVHCFLEDARHQGRSPAFTQPRPPADSRHRSTTVDSDIWEGHVSSRWRPAAALNCVEGGYEVEKAAGSDRQRPNLTLGPRIDWASN